ncbi:TrmH family RNA methyltransferase [Engelhardtia mirabilis]|uniref:tRNA (Cytidine/uridine-2'-O-)-methyltransferase TrmJ n=1 Tax=Engelhardtia mirabilis TaxID=2528011 RepID=A0A518BR41_9BACT|nr:tRNA (cytidine/uridine-2'-O-)-methyltransferase TrmJ [Planctomycetes bacterium Pla133]QDV03768.1 tRNA (cytidine/uridine-2'-O-)-methyltransferase TrmJ [Planctomycetes bacterium Pla86]
MNRIVLCRPAGPRNVGSVLRAVLNFGPAGLHLVRPERPAILIHPEFEQMAHGVEDAAARIVVHDSLAEALADRTHAIGFTGKVRNHRAIQPFAARRSDLAELWADEDSQVALVFGAEQDGMRAEEADTCHELVYIETSDEHTSLNLSMAVAVVLFSLFQPGERPARRSRTTPLTGEAREFLTENVARTLGAKAWTPGARKDIEESARRVFARAPLEGRDARAWHQSMRALGSGAKPSDFGIGVDPDPAVGPAD